MQLKTWEHVLNVGETFERGLKKMISGILNITHK